MGMEEGKGPLHSLGTAKGQQGTEAGAAKGRATPQLGELLLIPFLQEGGTWWESISSPNKPEDRRSWPQVTPGEV